MSFSVRPMCLQKTPTRGTQQKCPLGQPSAQIHQKSQPRCILEPGHRNSNERMWQRQTQH